MKFLRINGGYYLIIPNVNKWTTTYIAFFDVDLQVKLIQCKILLCKMMCLPFFLVKNVFGDVRQV